LRTALSHPYVARVSVHFYAAVGKGERGIVTGTLPLVTGCRSQKGGPTPHTNFPVWTGDQ
jgi:hypothetical protein